MNKDDVINVLEKCAAFECDEKCPYKRVVYRCRSRLMLDAAELLKEQEPIKPKRCTEHYDDWVRSKFNSPNDWLCGLCGSYISRRSDFYCSRCGREIDWTEDLE